MQIKSLLWTVLTIYATSLTAQPEAPRALKFSSYMEVYYLYDFANPAGHQRPDFVYSFDRHNEVNLNFGYVKAAYTQTRLRSNLALMTGTYANANLAAEPGVLKNIYEANVGIKLSKTQDLWLDAGVFGSHIGFESAVGADCWNLTRSMLADNTPYYESGAKLTYKTADGKWLLSGLLLNGWQRIQRLPGNNTPAFGHQLTYTPSARITLNSSSFIGSDVPDPVRKMRYFHNLYGQFQLGEKWGLIAGFDLGAQQKERGSKDYALWYSPVLIGRYTPNEKLAIAARVEQYVDEFGVIISTSTPNGFRTWGYSLNLDWKLMDKALWRIEGKLFQGKDPLFGTGSNASLYNAMLATSISVKLE